MLQLKGIVEKYLGVFPNEKPRLNQLIQLLESGDSYRLYDRSYPLGHITASAFILSPCKRKVLLIHHRELNTFLQPGGHIEPSDASPLVGAIREVTEETGITGLRQLVFNTHDLIPFDIDSHHIPASESKKEPGHYHHDFRYLFISGSTAVNCTLESTAHRWVDIDTLPELGPYKTVVDKIRCALSKDALAKMFYDRIIEHLDVRQPIDTVVVAHLIPDVLPYLDAVSQVSNVLAVIPKPRSVVSEIKERVSREFTIVELSREVIAAEGLAPVTRKSNNYVLLDIGGYFSPVVSCRKAGRTNPLLGIVEDTENGYRKYAALESSTVPIFSVARSPLKDMEDFLVGQSVVFSADAVLRDLGMLFQYLRIGIMGFGKVGRSIMHHVMQRNIYPMVYDTNPIKRLEAYNLGARIPSRSSILSEAEVIFSATGSRALSFEDFRQLKPGCFVFSVTSSDDEMDLSRIIEEYESHVAGGCVTKFYGRQNHFYLVNDGNAVNFLHKAVLGNFIHLVRAEMLFALEALSHRRARPGIQEMSDAIRKQIASIWLDTYVGNNNS